MANKQQSVQSAREMRSKGFQTHDRVGDGRLRLAVNPPATATTGIFTRNRAGASKYLTRRSFTPRARCVDG